MNWLSLLLPFAYLTILIGSLATFSHLYRRRQAVKAASLAPWFPPHLQRNIYLSLLELQASPDTKVPDSVLKAALLRRATEDIYRLMNIRSAKPAIAQLLQRGSVGDELWQRFQLAEKEMELELRDVIQEANALAPQQSWGQTIFQSASECAHNEMLRKKLGEIEEGRKGEREEWETRREGVREGFMKELEEADAAKEEPKPVLKTGSSDDDTVIVDNPGPTPPSDEQDGGTSSKKKKGKK